MGIGEEERKVVTVVLTKPLSLSIDGKTDDDKPPNVAKRILLLLKNIRPGTDLTAFQLPPLFNMPKSHLQCYGESVYCFGQDKLTDCTQGDNPLQRMLSVVAWSISTTRPALLGYAPYNPILGETHHVSSSHLNVLLEQISHHPPVSALHATNEKDNIQMIWCHQIVPKFLGTCAEAEVHGKRELKLLNHGETYVMNTTKLLFRFIPVPGVEWVGNVNIQCEESDLEAELCYKGSSILGRKGRYIKGKIFESSSSKTLYEISGYWDRTVSAKDVKEGKSVVIYDAMEVLTGLKTPTVKDPMGVWGSESAAVWSGVSEGIVGKDWEKAREAKKGVEERQREIMRENEAKGEKWVPKHFKVVCRKEMGWDCLPIKQWVPPAPIVVPQS